MSVKYHINPLTGSVSVCHATHGKCPFGGPDKHYKTYSDAQEYADKVAVEHFAAVDKQNGIMPEMPVWEELQRRQSVAKNFEYINDYSDKKLIKLLNRSKDQQELVRAIWNKDIIVDRIENNKEILKAALSSKSVPDDIIDEVAKHSENYSAFTIQSLSESPRVPITKSIQMLKGHNDTFAVSFFQSRDDLSGDYCDAVIDDMIENGTKNYPGNALYIGDAPHAYGRTLRKISEYRLVRKYSERPDK